MKRADSFVKALHGLRGIAVLYVLLSHMGNSHLFMVPYVAYNRIGKVGVVIFFVLSAFLLTGKLHRELVRHRRALQAIGTYLIHRFFRIYPLFALVLVLHVLSGHFGWYAAGQHLLLLRGFRELWAIPVEFKYYFCMPLVALLAARLGIRLALSLLCMGVAAACAYAFVSPDIAFSNSINLGQKLVPFLFGSVMALALDDPAVEILVPRMAGPWLGWVSLLLLVAATVLFHMGGLEDQAIPLSPLVLIAITLAASGLIVTALQDGLISRILGGKPLVFIGEVSFSIYLLHEFVIGWTRRSGLASGVEAWIAFLASVAVAWVSYRCIERPGIEKGYKLGDWIVKDRSVTAPDA